MTDTAQVRMTVDAETVAQACGVSSHIINDLARSNMIPVASKTGVPGKREFRRFYWDDMPTIQEAVSKRQRRVPRANGYTRIHEEIETIRKDIVGIRGIIDVLVDDACTQQKRLDTLERERRISANDIERLRLDMSALRNRR